MSCRVVFVTHTWHQGIHNAYVRDTTGKVEAMDVTSIIIYRWSFNNQQHYSTSLVTLHGFQPGIRTQNLLILFHTRKFRLCIETTTDLNPIFWYRSNRFLCYWSNRFLWYSAILFLTFTIFPGTPYWKVSTWRKVFVLTCDLTPWRSKSTRWSLSDQVGFGVGCCHRLFK